MRCCGALAGKPLLEVKGVRLPILSDQIYQLIVEDDEGRVCKDISSDACREVPGNFLYLILAQFITKIADACSSTKLIIPWLFTAAGVPAFFSGLLVPIRESGSLLPQLVIAGVMRSQPWRKWFLVWGYLGQGLGLITMAWIAVHLTGVAAGWGVLVALVVISLARGCSSVASKDVIGKTIPKTRRGALNGYSASAAGLVTLMFGCVLAVGVTEHWQSLSPLLIIAGCLSALAAGVYALVREYPGAVDGGASALRAAIESIGVLKTDRPFRLFISVRALMMCSGLSAPFFILIVQKSEQSLQSLGLFVLVSGLASMLSGIIWGRFSDASSRTVMVVTAALTAVVCGLGAVSEWLSVSSLYWVLVLYFCLSVVHEGVRVGRKTYVLDLAGGQKRTDYVAVGNTLIGILLLAVGVLTAVLAHFSVELALALFGGMGAAGAVLALRLPEV